MRMLVPLLALVVDEQPVVVVVVVERSTRSQVLRMPCVNHSLVSKEVEQMG